MGRIKSLLNKHEFFLKKAKLIIGNGIDLHCGFKTSYSDYFNTNDDRFGNGSLTKAFSEIYQRKCRKPYIWVRHKQIFVL